MTRARDGDTGVGKGKVGIVAELERMVKNIKCNSSHVYMR